ncbi:MAG: laccase domain-containing protein, partial [Firmicutes bacterium]|nr:laccase domain-containing protein [Bacillota bacterium]
MQYNEITILDTAAAAGFFTTRNTTAKARRTALAEQAKTFGGTIAWPHLVHGTHIVQLTEEHLGKGLLELPDTDGCITDVPGIALTVTCGDCLPIYLFDPQHQAIGLAHAGWKGTLGGIAASLVAAMQKAYGTDPAQLIGRVGPGISPCCFQVRKDCYEQFT